MGFQILGVVGLALELMIAGLRGLVAILMFISGGISGVVFATAELLALVLAFANMGRRRDRDTSARGLVVPLLYCSCFVLSPTMPSSWAGSTVVVVCSLLAIYVRLACGSSFTVGPSSWVTLRDKGPYAAVRHPCLSVAVLMRLGAWMAYPTEWNLAVFGLSAACVFVIALVEEAYLLGVSSEYAAYCERVPCRFVPFLKS